MKKVVNAFIDVIEYESDVSVR